MKVSDLKTTEELHTSDLDDPEYRAEWERTLLGHEVAMRVIAYRVEHELTQTELARMLARAFHEDPARVAELVIPFLREQVSASVA